VTPHEKRIASVDLHGMFDPDRAEKVAQLSEVDQTCDEYQQSIAGSFSSRLIGITSALHSVSLQGEVVIQGGETPISRPLSPIDSMGLVVSHSSKQTADGL
jgi:hypothetical protein